MTKNFHLNAFNIFLVSETTIDSFFQNSQFRLTGYRMFRDNFGGGLCMFVNERISVKKLNPHKDDSETFVIEINLCLRKWLRVKAYKPL